VISQYISAAAAAVFWWVLSSLHHLYVVEHILIHCS